MAYTYDPKTGKWTKSTSSESKNATQPAPASSSPPSGESNLKATNSDKNTSTGTTEKEYNEIEVNTLQGSLNFIVTEETIKLKAGDTLKINGIGKYLSGNYYVKEVTRQISSNGYSHSATVIKTDFGGSLKSSTTAEEKKEEKPVESSQAPARTYTVKKGDCLWAIAKQLYGNGADWEKIYNANTDKCGKPYNKGGTTYCLIYPGQVLTIP